MFPRMQLVLCHYIKRHMSSRLIPSLQLREGKEKRNKLAWKLAVFKAFTLKVLEGA